MSAAASAGRVETRMAELALALEGARRGARMIRVHDVRETVQALKVQAAVVSAGPIGE